MSKLSDIAHGILAGRGTSKPRAKAKAKAPREPRTLKTHAVRTPGGVYVREVSGGRVPEAAIEALPPYAIAHRTGETVIVEAPSACDASNAARKLESARGKTERQAARQALREAAKAEREAARERKRAEQLQKKLEASERRKEATVLHGSRKLRGADAEVARIVGDDRASGSLRLHHAMQEWRKRKQHRMVAAAERWISRHRAQLESDPFWKKMLGGDEAAPVPAPAPAPAAPAAEAGTPRSVAQGYAWGPKALAKYGANALNHAENRKRIAATDRDRHFWQGVIQYLKTHAETNPDVAAERRKGYAHGENVLGPFLAALKPESGASSESREKAAREIIARTEQLQKELGPAHGRSLSGTGSRQDHESAGYLKAHEDAADRARAALREEPRPAQLGKAETEAIIRSLGARPSQQSQRLAAMSPEHRQREKEIARMAELTAAYEESGIGIRGQSWVPGRPLPLEVARVLRRNPEKYPVLLSYPSATKYLDEENERSRAESASAPATRAPVPSRSPEAWADAAVSGQILGISGIDEAMALAKSNAGNRNEEIRRYWEAVVRALVPHQERATRAREAQIERFAELTVRLEVERGLSDSARSALKTELLTLAGELPDSDLKYARRVAILRMLPDRTPREWAEEAADKTAARREARRLAESPIDDVKRYWQAVDVALGQLEEAEHEKQRAQDRAAREAERLAEEAEENDRRILAESARDGAAWARQRVAEKVQTILKTEPADPARGIRYLAQTLDAEASSTWKDEPIIPIPRMGGAYEQGARQAFREEAQRLRAEYAAPALKSSVQAPPAPQASGGVTFGVPKAELLNAIASVRYAASDDDLRQSLSGVALVLDHHGQLRALATDGHRLATVKISRPAGPPPAFEALIYHRRATKGVGSPLDQLIEAAKKGAANTILGVRPVARGYAPKLSVNGDDIPVKEAHVPPWEQVIPKKFQLRVNVDRQALLDAIKKSAMGEKVRGKGRFVVMRWAPSDSGATITFVRSNTVLQAEVLGGSLPGERLTGFIFEYLLEAVQHLKGHRAVISLGPNELDPLLITDPNENYLAIVMPRRTDSGDEAIRRDIERAEESERASAERKREKSEERAAVRAIAESGGSKRPTVMVQAPEGPQPAVVTLADSTGTFAVTEPANQTEAQRSEARKNRKQVYSLTHIPSGLSIARGTLSEMSKRMSLHRPWGAAIARFAAGDRNAGITPILSGLARGYAPSEKEAAQLRAWSSVPLTEEQQEKLTGWRSKVAKKVETSKAPQDSKEKSLPPVSNQDLVAEYDRGEADFGRWSAGPAAKTLKEASVADLTKAVTDATDRVGKASGLKIQYDRATTAEGQRRLLGAMYDRGYWEPALRQFKRWLYEAESRAATSGK